jgi:hypothetical protein
MWSIARNSKEDTITFMMESVVVYETRYHDDAAPLYEEMFMEMGRALGRQVCLHENHHSEEELKEIIPPSTLRHIECIKAQLKERESEMCDFYDRYYGPNGRQF